MFCALLLSALLATAHCCGRAQRPYNAGEFYSSSTLATGTTVDYVCDPGYEILGPQRRVCSENGSWIPLGLPFCVTDVAEGKKAKTTPPPGTDIERTLNCGDVSLKTTHSWYVDLENKYRVIVLSLSYEQSNTRAIEMELTVGNDTDGFTQNEICSKFRGTYLSGQTVYFLCPVPLIGRYVFVRVKSVSAFRLPFCVLHVMSDQAPPVFDEVTTRTVVHTTPSQNDLEVQELATTVIDTTPSYHDPERAESQMIARIVGITVGTGGVSVILAFVMVLAVQKLRNWYRDTRAASAGRTRIEYVDDPLITVSKGAQPPLAFYLSTSSTRRCTRTPVSSPSSGRRCQSTSSETIQSTSSENGQMPAQEAVQAENFRESCLL